ncbi:hypothetical protein HDV05_000589 [Chytridiales sp. JEL 0842]|nr:hypothetical protein HDV05_000589 [Chytridiales sp. JEL 0842]
MTQSHPAPTEVPRDPTPTIDWSNLAFDYVKVRSHIKYVHKDGKWDEGELVNDSKITLDIAATALHYGQTCFEGLKAFRMSDGKVRIFRPHLNAKRIQSSCLVSSMAAPPESLFLTALKRVVQDNLDFVPPINSGGSMYIRPFVFGSGPQVGLYPAKETTFIILVLPVGNFYKGGFGSPVKALVARNLDRASKYGTGHVKIGGNYATVFRTTEETKRRGNGFVVNLFLDAETRTQVEEFATSNFAAVKVEGDKVVYVTPKSRSILPSVTNRSLAELAHRKFGWEVERRVVKWDELKSGSFAEVAACGTAVVITPVSEIHRELQVPGTFAPGKVPERGPFDWDDAEDDREMVYDPSAVEVVKFGENGFKHFNELYAAYRDLQNGTLEGWQSFGWMWPPEGL